MSRSIFHAVHILAVGLVISLGPVNSARAGIYNTAEEDDIKLSASFDKFNDTLKKVQSIGIVKQDFNAPLDDKRLSESRLRKRYLLWEALGGKSPPRDLTPEEMLNYSAVLIRRKSPDAIRYLEELTRKNPDNLLYQSHLAHAYWVSGPENERRAIDTLHQLLSKRAWPEHFNDIGEEQRDFLIKIGMNEPVTEGYRVYEGYLLKLMRLRSQEPPGQPFQAVDAIFDGGDPKTPIKFVGESGKFEPGKVSATELKKLPRNARDIVQQLLLWLPTDQRLYWLLGEIYHAEAGEKKKPEDREASLGAASQIFDYLVFNDNLRAPDLRERRVRLADYLKESEKDIKAMLKDAEKNDPPPPAGPLLAMTPQTLAVTFASGFVVGLFALWQFQELRRRRRGG